MNQNVKVIPVKASLNQNNRKTVKNQLVPGTFKAEIVAVDQAPDYDQDEAVKIEYAIDTGTKIIEYEEIFINDRSNSRTDAFFDQMAAAGICISDWGELVGMKVEVTFKKQVRNRRTFLNIVAYKF